ncbi:uncharacterized protein LOC134197579 [Corticium candelabrum]|uniref:uncharacterized protein LOC134197579 n=1 Tax=Corticium candelabrum TaxID=121492 RepID=UPI002E26BCE3|nr:uncharacterized protein LOC134197579 [Corticium candelabrum]
MGRKVKRTIAKKTDLRAKRTSTKKKKKKLSKASSADLLEMAEECMAMMQPDVAATYCRQALELEPDRVETLEMLAVVLLECARGDARGDARVSDESIVLLRRAIELQPDDGYSKYMYLGQMLEGSDALQCYLKGIAIMEREHEAERSVRSDNGTRSCDTDESQLSLDLSNACCSAAELYVTDLCHEVEAEGQCETFCLKALEYAPENPQALQVSSSFLLSANRINEARDRIKRSVAIWLTVPDDSDQEVSFDINSLERFPPYFVRMNCVKILIEVGEYDLAYHVISTLLAEDDEVVAVWYLAGWMYHLQGEGYSDEAARHLLHAKQLASKVVCDDTDMLKHVDELLASLENVELKLGDDDDDNDDDDDYDECDGDECDENIGNQDERDKQMNV